MQKLGWRGLLLLLAPAYLSAAGPSQTIAAFSPNIPVVWDDGVMEHLELPLASGARARHVPSSYYYQIPVRPIYKTYPIYSPDREPPGYYEDLLKKEPEIVFDASKLRTQQDWILAGKEVFESGVGLSTVDTPFTQVRNRQWYTETQAPVTKDGIMPLFRYVIRKRGEVGVTLDSCASCHTRVLADGTIVPGAQGSIAQGKMFAYQINHSPPAFGTRFLGPLLLDLYGTPWIERDRERGLLQGKPELVAKVLNDIPHGVLPRQGTSIAFPMQIPDLIGVSNRKYLDHTGLQHNRSIADLMRYDAINNFIDELTSYNEFRPYESISPPQKKGDLPDLQSQSRYSDEQLYALALYIQSLKPPPNPNQPSALTRRGEQVFVREGCGGCHTPPLYTNNKLTPADGYDWRSQSTALSEDILPVSVGTDNTDALYTRRGTGFYKVPSLRGIWYRSPLEHNGSVDSLEEWFDPARLSIGFQTRIGHAYGKQNGSVAGHPFGLKLASDDRAALIAFLRTL